MVIVSAERGRPCRGLSTAGPKSGFESGVTVPRTTWRVTSARPSSPRHGCHARSGSGALRPCRRPKGRASLGKDQGRPEMRSRSALVKRWETVAAAAAAAMAVTEAIVSMGTEVQWGGFLFAALFAAGAFLIYRGTAVRTSLILLAVLYAVELAFIPFYERATASDWIFEGLTLLFSGIGFVAALGAILVDRRSRLAHRQV